MIVPKSLLEPAADASGPEEADLTEISLNPEEDEEQQQRQQRVKEDEDRVLALSERSKGQVD